MTDFLNNIVSAWNDEEGETESEAYPDETNSSNINILIRAARMFLDKKISKEDFIREVDATTDRLDKALGELQDFEEHLPDDDPRKALSEQSEKAYEEFGLGLEEMEGAQAHRITVGIEMCIQAASKLENLDREYLELEQQSQLVECLRCSHTNTPERDTCESCSSALPKAMREASAENTNSPNDFVMLPQEYIDLYEACDKVASGDIQLETWQELVYSFNDYFNSSSQQIHDISSTHREIFSSHQELLAAANAVVSALDQSIEALHHMNQFSDDGDVEHLNQGWMSLMAATPNLQQRALDFYQMLESAQES